jgi:hypothetical protein
MTSRLHRTASRRFNRAAVICLALAVALQTLGAAFAFPASAGRGETFVICTAEGLRTVVVDDGQGAPVERGHACPACLAGHCVAAHAVAVGAVEQSRVDLTRVATRAERPTPALPRRPALRGGLASRGPPAEILSHA